MSTINKETMINICKYGTYYNPASKHYTEGANVVCDKCYKNNLSICIGWNNYDMCLLCVNDVNESIRGPVKVRLDREEIKTYMMQRLFRNQ